MADASQPSLMITCYHFLSLRLKAYQWTFSMNRNKNIMRFDLAADPTNCESLIYRRENGKETSFGGKSHPGFCWKCTWRSGTSEGTPGAGTRADQQFVGLGRW